MEITLKGKKTGRAITIEREFGPTLEDAVAQYGAEAVYALAEDKFVIKVQDVGRIVLNKPEASEDDAVAAAMAYVPGKQATRAPRVQSTEKAMSTLAAAVAKGTISLDDIRRMLETQAAAQA